VAAKAATSKPRTIALSNICCPFADCQIWIIARPRVALAARCGSQTSGKHSATNGPRLEPRATRPGEQNAASFCRGSERRIEKQPTCRDPLYPRFTYYCENCKRLATRLPRFLTFFRHPTAMVGIRCPPPPSTGGRRRLKVFRIMGGSRNREASRHGKRAST
jgi:hypothetical protein